MERNRVFVTLIGKPTMQKTIQLESGGLYMIESLSSGNSGYFENSEEIKIFKNLFKRYLGKYVEIYKQYISCEGYQIMLRVRSSSVIRRIYKISNNKRGRVGRIEFVMEPWRIVSEQIRILHSVYVKVVNKIRGRKGVLVQQRYSRYYFVDEEELMAYMKNMEVRKKKVRGQEDEKYRVSEELESGVRWGDYRCKEWVESAMDKEFQGYVVSKLVKYTILAHSHPN